MELGSCLTYAAETDIRQAAKCNDYQELLKKSETTTFGMVQISQFNNSLSKHIYS